MQSTVWKSCEALQAYQLQALRDVIRHAWKHSAFYRDLYSGHGIREKDIGDLTAHDLPFTDKKILMEHFDAVVTDSKLQKKKIDQWFLESKDPSETFANEFVVAHSTGTSGYPGIWVFDRTGYNVMTSTMAMRLPPPEPDERTKVAVYRMAGGHFTGVTAAVRMPKAVYDVSVVSLQDSPEKVIAQLNAFQPHRINSYSSSATTLAEYARQGKLRIQPRNLFVSGDSLTESMEHIIHEAWGASVYILYATSESPCLALREPGRDEMTVMDDLNVLEVLGDDNLPVPAGEVGRVIITNLYNYALPILRYDLGDTVVRGQPQGDSPFTTIRNLVGRESEMLPIMLHDGTEDSLLPGIIYEDYMVPGLEKIQFISKGLDNVLVHYVADRDVEAELRSAFQRLLDQKRATRTRFDVLRVSDIPPNPRTGKLQFVRREGTGTDRSTTHRMTPSSAPVPKRSEGPTNPFDPFPMEEIEGSIPERFERQVERAPDRLAVKTQTEEMTYAELNRAANRIAHAILDSDGDGAEPVALLLEQGISLIAAILGVLKAGRFYLPLDSSFPPQRTAFMVEDSGTRLILTDRKNLSLAQELSQDKRQVINCEEINPDIEKENPRLSISHDQYAWLLYTSGSTGQPKGVLQNHRNVLHFVLNYTNAIHISTEDRLSLLRHISVFGAIRDILGALLNGAGLYPFDVRNEGVLPLSDWLRREEITICFFGSPLFRSFLDTLTGEEDFSALRLIRLGSDSVRKDDVERFQKHFSPECILVNGLSSTETATVRRYFIHKDTPIHTHSVPVGYPVENADVLLLDENGAGVPAGEVGEIVIRSRYLALGYWKRPDLTDAVFSDDPAGDGLRLYRMGDLGRKTEDGLLEHLGRKDFQVKIRGYRVEIGEVEKALLDLEQIKDAVLMVREDQPGDQRLIAYAVPATQPAPTVTSLRRALAVRFPEHMIPSAFVMLDTIPLNPNGKVDRLALPEPESVRPEVETSFIAPRTSIEEMLQNIWMETLGLDRIGMDDQFMELGGHSLQAGRIIARVAEEFGIVVPLRAFFEEPTIANLASLITEQLATNLDASDMTQILDEVEGRLKT